jgi:hypothetical protein
MIYSKIIDPLYFSTFLKLKYLRSFHRSYSKIIMTARLITTNSVIVLAVKYVRSIKRTLIDFRKRLILRFHFLSSCV